MDRSYGPGGMQISRHWRLNSQRYGLEGVRYQDGGVSLQNKRSVDYLPINRIKFPSELTDIVAQEFMLYPEDVKILLNLLAKCIESGYSTIEEISKMPFLQRRGLDINIEDLIIFLSEIGILMINNSSEEGLRILAVINNVALSELSENKQIEP